jgi:hypothetical protein
MKPKNILALAISVVIAILALKVLGFIMHFSAYVIWLIMIAVITYPIYLIVSRILDKD